MAAEQAERDKRVWIASRDGDVEELRAALEAGGDPNSKPEDDGDAAIHVAVAGHHTDVVRVLAESGADGASDSFLRFIGGRFEVSHATLVLRLQ